MLPPVTELKGMKVTLVLTVWVTLENVAALALAAFP
jgi:hypothetical protein